VIGKEQMIDYWTANGIVHDDRLIEAFRRVERENFVLNRSQAYIDSALPIKCGQTISQPTTIMIMLQALELKRNDKVLEIGTGSGYNLALICSMVRKAYSLEIHRELIDLAEANLQKEGITNFEIFNRNGYEGLKEKSLFDKIILTAAPERIPERLIEQLKEGGILIGPIGKYLQKMIKITKSKNGLVKEDFGEFVFVRMV